MKKHISLFAALFFFVAISAYYGFAATHSGAQSSATTENVGNNEFSGKFENGVRTIEAKAWKDKFEPELITVKLGEKIRLVVTGMDPNHDHNIIISDFKVKLFVPAGKTGYVDFAASKQGTFQLSCRRYDTPKPKYWVMHTKFIVK
jgi:heme/copper-type cytochrome/quinol oxidase subunit 2